MECSLRARLGALRSSRHRHWQTECALSSHQRSDDNQQEREGLRPIFPPHRGRTPAWLCDTSCLSRQYDFREVRLTSGAQRGLASSRPEPHVLLGTNERGGQPWVSLARRSSSVSMFTRTPLPWPTRQRTAVRRWCRWG